MNDEFNTDVEAAEAWAEFELPTFPCDSDPEPFVSLGFSSSVRLGRRKSASFLPEGRRLQYSEYVSCSQLHNLKPPLITRNEEPSLRRSASLQPRRLTSLSLESAQRAEALLIPHSVLCDEIGEFQRASDPDQKCRLRPKAPRYPSLKRACKKKRPAKNNGMSSNKRLDAFPHWRDVIEGNYKKDERITSDTIETSSQTLSHTSKKRKIESVDSQRDIQKHILNIVETELSGEAILGHTEELLLLFPALRKAQQAKEVIPNSLRVSS